MKLLLDTHILIWAMGEPARLGPALRDVLEDPQHTLCFSVASLWELVIKAGLGRPSTNAVDASRCAHLPPRMQQPSKMDLV